MLKINIPNSFSAERRYIIEVLIGHFLGLEYEIEAISGTSDYSIHLENASKLIIDDGFFSKLDENKGYFNQKHLPKPPEVCSSDLCSFPIQVMYGESKISVETHEITCSIDVFAGAFFLLTQWEERILEKDAHSRGIESQTYSVKHKLHHIPIVDQYVDLLWNMLQSLGYTGARKQTAYEVIVTHDVDHIARYDSFGKLFRALAGDILLRKNPFRLVTTLKEFMQVNFGGAKDNYDTYGWLMDSSDARGLKSRFYFIPGIRGEEDFRYNIFDDRIKDTIANIRDRGHVVGIHGSYSSYNNSDQFQTEVKRLAKVGASVQEGRQHYLRFENPTTWANWADSGLQTDSSIGYNSDIGFKAGTSHKYPVFDVVKRSSLKLSEQPLIIMEVPLIKSYKTVDAAFEVSKTVIDQCKRHRGQLVFLWHPENFNHPFWGSYKNLYTKILDYATKAD